LKNLGREKLFKNCRDFASGAGKFRGVVKRLELTIAAFRVNPAIVYAP